MSVDKRDYISMLLTLLVFLISNNTAKTKLAILAFLYCGEIVKNSIPVNTNGPEVFRMLIKETR